MKIIDEKARLWGKVSVIDLLILAAVLALGAGFLHKQTSAEISTLVNADTPFYVTMAANGLREFSVNAVAEGDVMFKQHDRQAMGRVVALQIKPATDYLLYNDGTAVLAEMEDRYRVFITLECVGTVNEMGYYINGNMHIAEGSEMVLVSNRVILPDSLVYRISETLE